MKRCELWDLAFCLTSLAIAGQVLCSVSAAPQPPPPLTCADHCTLYAASIQSSNPPPQAPADDAKFVLTAVNLGTGTAQTIVTWPTGFRRSACQTSDCPAQAPSPPSSLQVDSAKHLAYILNENDRSVDVLDLANDTFKTRIPWVLDEPGGMVLSPYGTALYLFGEQTGAQPDLMLAALDTNLWRATKIHLPKLVSHMVISHSGITAYLVSYIDGSVYPIDLRTYRLGAPMAAPYGYEIQNFTITPDDKTAYATGSYSNQDGEVFVITAIDLVHGTDGQPVPTGTLSSPANLNLFIPGSGKWMYLMSGAPVGQLAGSGAASAETITRFDMPSLSNAPAQVLGTPFYRGITMAPDGSYLYLLRESDPCNGSCPSDYIVRYSLGSNSIVGEFQVPVLGSSFALGE